MKLSTMWLVFINAVITMISSSSPADNDCLTIGQINSISAPYNVYLGEHESSFVIEYNVEFENSKNATEIGEYSSTIDTIEVYSKKNNCRDNFKLKPRKHCCESKLAVKYSYAQADWSYYDSSFDMGCHNKTLSLTIQNPRDLYITLRLMSNGSIIHCYTTHLNHIPLIYHNSEQCMEPNNPCEEPVFGGIESIEMIEGPGLYKQDRPNFYTLYVNTDRNTYDTYNYKIAYKIKTSKKLAFHGWILTAWNPDLNIDDRIRTFYQFSWINGKGFLFDDFKYRFSDRYRFLVSMDSEKIILYNYSKNLINMGLRFEIQNSNLPLIFVDITKYNRPQENRTHFPSDRQTVTKQEPFIIQEQPIKTTSASPSELVTEMTTKLFNSTQSTNTKTEAGNVTDYFSDYKIDYFLFGLLGAGLILWTVWYYY